MNNLYTNAVIALVVLVVAILVFLALQGLRRPVLAKIGLRNISRRPAQSILIVIGLTLSTIIIISALSTGDTLNYSVQRQAVAAFGDVDEILAPPLLSTFIGAGAGMTADGETANAQQQQLENLTAGGLTSVLAVLEGGLPGISMERYAQLKTQAEAEPLIDGVAGSILFPTIIRNTSTGQGEPLGFVFAVDADYDQQFGITTVEGERVTMATLQPGVGNIFAQAANVFGMAQDLAAQAGLNVNISDLAVAAAGVGAVLTGAAGEGNVDLSELSLSTETLASLGIDPAPLEAQGIYSVTLASLGITTNTLQAIGVTTTTIQPGDLVSNTLGLDTSQVVSATNNLLGSFNLNTLGQEIDNALAPFGLQLRQGDIYLNRLGAAQLDAQVGDVLEIFIGPLPIPVRVKGIVEEAGPVGALLPTVMMPLGEAQKLFFMNGKVNNVLISNVGDELSGIEQTEAVSDRLRLLAMDEAALAQVVAILRRPDVQPAIAAAAAEAQENLFGDEGDPPPPFIADLLQNFTPLGGMLDETRLLAAGLQQEGLNADLQAAIASTTLRTWLLNDVDLPATARTDLQRTLSTLNQFDVIDGLNKQTVVLAANIGGTIFSSLFTLFGIFSILAAVLLIFLIFVMLATERRSEMGIARAIGVQRGHLVQMFVTEGMVYDLVAAAIGVALGLAVSYAMIGFLGNLVKDVAGGVAGGGIGVLQFRFRVAPTSLIIGYCLGVLLTYIVVTWSSWRVSRLNIVSAIRDLPEEVNARRLSLAAKIWRWASGPLLIVSAAYLISLGAANVTYWQIGGTLALTGLMLLIDQLPVRTTLRPAQIQRITYSVIGLGLLIIWGVPWNDVLGRTTMDVIQNDQGWALLSFALRGPLLILGAILAIMFNADLFSWLISRLLGGIGALTPVLKTAIAYPLSARFRTGMAMVMFSMIIATVVIMALVIQATQTLIVLDEQESGGFEISTSNTLLSFFNPLRDLEAEIPQMVAQYPRLADIDAVGAVVNQEVQVRQANDEEGWRRSELVGVNNGYLTQAQQVYALQARVSGYADDAAVWQALRDRDDVVIITPELLTSAAEAAFGDDAPEEFREFELAGVVPAGETVPELYLEVRRAPTEDPFSQTEGEAPVQRLQVIGVLADDTNRAGGPIQINLQALEPLTGETPAPDTFYIKVKAGADVRAVQQEVERAFLSSGINATILAEQFAAGQNITRGVLSLFQGFMALGLLVGIAALGVISTRTVVERRQQIGVLRAIGFQSRMVALSLVLEASFIALVGLLIGTGVGIVLGESIVRTFFTQITAETPFVIPWAQLAFILLLAYGFSLLTTIVPAYQAASIYPAEALRYE
jgi:putative ABC transport system permease protein